MLLFVVEINITLISFNQNTGVFPEPSLSTKRGGETNEGSCMFWRICADEKISAQLYDLGKVI